MEEIYNNESYSFKLQDIKFSIDLPNTFYYKNNNCLVDNNLEYNHYHAKAEVFFVQDEEIEIIFENNVKKFSNCILIIPPFTKHITKRKNDYVLLFSIENKKISSSPISVFYNEITKNTTYLTLKISNEIITMVGELYNLFKNNDESTSEIIISILKYIFYKTFTLNHDNVTTKEKNIKESYLIIIEQFINHCNEYKTNITLETIANKLYLSQKQTSRIIKKYFGKSLSSLILERKFIIACSLLENTNLSISEISEKSNFKTENYFYLKFKQYFGITPLKYRKNNKKVAK